VTRQVLIVATGLGFAKRPRRVPLQHFEAKK